MSAERIDHSAEARNLIEVERTPQNMGWETADAQHLANLAEAQVHATLALVEQQRIANVIALHRHEVEYDLNWNGSRLYVDGTDTLRWEFAAALDLEVAADG